MKHAKEVSGMRVRRCVLVLLPVLSMGCIFGHDVDNKGNPAYRTKGDILLSYDKDRHGLITVHDDVKHIGSNAFYGCKYVTHIYMHHGIESVGDHAFQDCIGLTKMSFPVSVTNIGRFAFAGCGALKSVDLPHNLEIVSGAVFWGCRSLAHIQIPIHVKRIGELAFARCWQLNEIHIPANVRRIERCAFIDCTALKALDFSEGTTSIGESAFAGCVSLERVVMPASLRELGDNAFSRCKRLKYVEFLGAVPAVNDFSSVFTTDDVPLVKVEKVYWHDTGCVRFPQIVERGNEMPIEPLKVVVPGYAEEEWLVIEKKCNDSKTSNRRKITLCFRHGN